MSLVGLDVSINGTGAAFDTGSFHFHTLLKRLPKKLEKVSIHNLSAHTACKFSRDLNWERYYLNSVDIAEKCALERATEAAIEGYAYSHAEDSSGFVFDIGEYTGNVKHALAAVGVKIFVYAPSEIKKFGSGKGNATKVLMVEAFLERTGPEGDPVRELIDLVGAEKKYASPVNDLVDAYWLMKLHESRRKCSTC